MISDNSPCVNICLSQRDMCVTCGRTFEEIRDWSFLRKYERKEINLNISKKKIILILEDAEYRINDFIKNVDSDKYILILTNHVKDCIYYLKNIKIDILSLDHDLNGKKHVEIGEDETGYDVALFLKDNPEYKPNKIFIHSKFEKGIRNMINLIPEAVVTPLLWENKEGIL